MRARRLRLCCLQKLKACILLIELCAFVNADLCTGYTNTLSSVVLHRQMYTLHGLSVSEDVESAVTIMASPLAQPACKICEPHSVMCNMIADVDCLNQFTVCKNLVSSASKILNVSLLGCLRVAITCPVDVFHKRALPSSPPVTIH
jgi:hypothetical protein